MKLSARSRWVVGVAAGVFLGGFAFGAIAQEPEAKTTTAAEPPASAEVAAEDPVPPLVETVDEESLRQGCIEAAAWHPTAAARPTAADRQRFGGPTTSCAPYLLAARRDPTNGAAWEAGRACCLVQGTCQRDLAEIFTNGWGTTRDDGAAAYFLCQAAGEMAPLEHQMMLAHLYRRSHGQTEEPLAYCDWIASSAGSAYCATQEFELAQPRWQTIRTAIEAQLDPALRATLAPLIAAAEAYAVAMATCVGDLWQGGTGYAGAVRREHWLQLENFWSLLEELNQERADPSEPAETTTATQELTAQIEQRLEEITLAAAELREREPLTATDEIEALPAANLRLAHTALLHYRDAFAAFYRARWSGAAEPAALDREITTLLFTRGAEDLRALSEGE